MSLVIKKLPTRKEKFNVGLTHVKLTLTDGTVCLLSLKGEIFEDNPPMFSSSFDAMSYTISAPRIIDSKAVAERFVRRLTALPDTFIDDLYEPSQVWVGVAKHAMILDSYPFSVEIDVAYKPE